MSESFTPLTVTVCVLFQLVVVKVRLAGDAVAAPVSLEETPTVTLALGCVASFTVKVPLPASPTVRRGGADHQVRRVVVRDADAHRGRLAGVAAARRARRHREALVVGVRVVHTADRHRLRTVPVGRRESQARGGYRSRSGVIGGDRDVDLPAGLRGQLHGEGAAARLILRSGVEALTTRFAVSSSVTLTLTEAVLPA